MRSYLKIAVLLVCVLLLLCGCGKPRLDTDGEEQTNIDYTGLDISEYIGEISYLGLTVSLESENSSKEDALWSEILENTEIKGYPEDKVKYYFEQQRASYMYLAGDEDGYEMLLKIRGITEEDMLAEAEKMVAKDLVFRLVVEREGIELTENEKTELFDRYAEKYVKDYGYTKSYVISDMPNIIYESMLYDKTMEYLILKNNFVTAD